MPALAAHDEDRRIRLLGQPPLDLFGRRLLDAGLDFLPLLVLEVQLLRELDRLRAIIRRQQFRRRPRITDTPARIQARPQHERRVIDRLRRLDARHFRQRFQPRILQPLEHLQPPRDERTIDAFQRRHVAQRAERREIEPLHLVRQPARRLNAPLACKPVQRGHEDKHHARRREKSVPRRIVRPVGIHQRQRLRHVIVMHQVVIHHHHIEPDLVRRLQRRNCRRAAIHRHHQLRTHALQRPKRTRRRTKALGQAIRHIQDQFPPPRAKITRQDRRRCAAVDIIVREHRHLLVVDDRIEDHLCRRVHVSKRRWIRKQLLQCRIEKQLRLIRLDAARRQHPTHHVRRAQPPRMLRCQPVVRRPLPPGLAGQRVRNAKEMRCVVHENHSGNVGLPRLAINPKPLLDPTTRVPTLTSRLQGGHDANQTRHGTDRAHHRRVGRHRCRSRRLLRPGRL